MYVIEFAFAAIHSAAKLLDRINFCSSPSSTKRRPFFNRLMISTTFGSRSNSNNSSFGTVSTRIWFNLSRFKI